MNYVNWIIPIILILILGCYYFGKKLQGLFHLKKDSSKKIYWILIIILISSIFLFRSVLIGFVLYFILFHALLDVMKLLLQIRKKDFKILQSKTTNIIIIGCCIIITIYGYYNINHPIIKEYQITIEKRIDGKFIIGMISDLHLGINHQEELLTQIVEHANSLQADIFVFGGDIFDEYTKEELKKNAIQKFGTIKTKYGIFYIEGNHDLLTEETRNILNQNNIQALEDQSIEINHQINIIGRKDYRNNSLKNPRKKLEDFMKEINNSLPIILLDHQPMDQKLASSLPIDLQLSGHTHAGQIFPVNFILQHGYKKQNNYHIIVSSGYGVWGYPIRTAGRSEMIKVTLSN